MSINNADNNQHKEQVNADKTSTTSPFVKGVIITCCLVIVAIIVVTALSVINNSGEITPTAEARSIDQPVVVPAEVDASAYGYVSEVDIQPDILPEKSECSQLILADCDGSDVKIDFFELIDNKWVHRLSTSGKCGSNGTTKNKTDGDLCTPEGEFELTFCCGISKPTTNLDFQWVDSDTVWVDDPDSVYYNTIQSSVIKGEWDSAELLYTDYFSNKSHNYCINIAVNGDGLTRGEAIPGKGAFITICGKTTPLKETEGCIDIHASQMSALLGYLDANKNPEIIIY